MFNRDITREFSKLDVLESKLNIYETLSREMLEKLENAVDKISESNQRIANILTKHDERIDQSIKTDELLIKMIDELKTENQAEHQKTANKIEKIESKLEDVGKIKWMTIGCGIVLAVLATSVSTLASGWWTPAGIEDHVRIMGQRLDSGRMK